MLTDAGATSFLPQRWVRFKLMWRNDQTAGGRGIPVSINVAPVIPFLTDHRLETLLEAGRAISATNAGYILLRLPGLVADPLPAQGRARHVACAGNAWRSG